MGAPENAPIDASARGARGSKVYGALFGRWSRLFALIALALSGVLPKAGVGFSICLFHHWTKLPCPGCGLTRSVACITHLDPRAAFAYHPFGFVVYALFVVLAVSNFVGESGRLRIQRWFQRHGN